MLEEYIITSIKGSLNSKDGSIEMVDFLNSCWDVLSNQCKYKIISILTSTDINDYYISGIWERFLYTI